MAYLLTGDRDAEGIPNDVVVDVKFDNRPSRLPLFQLTSPRSSQLKRFS